MGTTSSIEKLTKAAVDGDQLLLKALIDKFPECKDSEIDKVSTVDF